MGHIREFDGVRGLLALWVFIAHGIELGPFSSIAGHLRPQYAVDVFIILSGFVIFHLLSRGEDYATFITRRFFRLFPVFALCFLFALLLRGALRVDDEVAFGFIGKQSLTPHLIAHATMLHGAVPEQILPNSAESVLPPAWSISLEWQFYLLAPVLFWFAMRPQWKSGLVLAALVAIRVLSIRHSVGLLVPGTPRDLTFNLSAFFPLKVEFFAAGALSWMLWRAYDQGRVRLTSRRLALAVAGALVMMIATESLALGLWMAGFVFLIDAHGEHFWRGSTLFSRFLSHRAARFLGEISYSFYLVHVPVIVAVRQFVFGPDVISSPKLFAVALMAVSGAAALALAWLLHVGVEEPMIAFGKRLTLRWSNTPQTAPALVPGPAQPITAQSSSQ
jgi:peptidoglycan/LPS O-acetylase OafA/YrhL